jgi:hypothetical protein
MAALDALAAAGEVAAEEIETARRAVLDLLEQPGDFHSTYLIHLQTNPDVVMAHADVRSALRAGIG